jgi:Zn-finger protein
MARGVALARVDNGRQPEPGSTPAASVAVDSPYLNEEEESVSSVWDFDHIQRNGTAKGSQSWTCLWCNQTFKQWNATKVLYHLVKINGRNVRTCKATHDPKSKELYRSLLKEKEKSQTSMEGRASKYAMHR